ncbi:hypothetical protein [Massilia endophytica]|uniref:hypothetical protein n=1 Tax=Massilia endophytica TaxID=2899220 RepID=UPI001E4325A4|nr:hypothetical protein [Massilia endophytica]UGQ45101.1 hypothetical protein LSQ66_15010 [Massilia endophytica]
MKKPIGPGSAVTFDTEHGSQTGTVETIQTDITNGARIAAVSVPGAMNGAPWKVLVNDLKPVLEAA